MHAGTTLPPGDVLDDPRLTEALEEYLAALESGQKPDRDQFLRRHADLATALAECLPGLELLHGTAAKLAPAGPPPAAPPPLPLGDFRIVREVGRGGMGVVYEAVQLSLSRRVALKVLPFAATLDPRQLQRFKNEAQAAALLHHSHIVPVFAVGCERGVYYYAMQFIAGRTVAALIAELRQEAPTAVAPAGASTIRRAGTAGTDAVRDAAYCRRVARLAVQAAEALEHAHQQGIVHRDVKPANLLIDDQEHLWITDFGLARCQGDTGLTASGDLVGTLRYMSPEQGLGRRGTIDHRTDLYALGATLYELLTLQPVFPGTDRQELLRQMAWDEPRPPRSLCPALPHELETILLKTLEKVPDERYQSAQELADDLRRFLEDRPIRARRPTPRERVLRWLRRHRAVAAAALVVLLLGVVGLAISTVLIAHEQARTQAAYEAEAANRARAEENFRQARRVLDYFARVSEADMADQPEMQPVRRKLLEAARDYYEEFIAQCPDDPAARAELAACHLRVAKVLGEIGSQADALAAIQRAREIQERLVREHPSEPAFQQGLSSIYQNMGLLQGGGQLALLASRPVQDDLKLSAEQRKALAPLLESRRELFRDGGQHSLEEWRRKLDELTAQEEKLPTILPEAQLRRLQQIALQQRGVQAFQEPELAAALALTAEQKQVIHAIRQQSSAGRDQPSFGPPWSDWRKPEGKSVTELILSVLTPEQQATWKELTGEPFKGEVRFGSPSGYGPPGFDFRRRPSP